MILPDYPELRDNKQRKVTPDLIVADEDRKEIMDHIRTRLYGLDSIELYTIAARIRRTPRCLYAIRCGQTRWPRWDTLFELLPRIGLRLSVRNANIKVKHDNTDHLPRKY